MTVLLAGVTLYTIMGGMLSVLITDFLQFVVMSVGLIVITILLLTHVGWGALVGSVQAHYGEGGFNPFANASMGWSYVIFNAFLNTAAALTWQTQIARILASKDARTGQRVYTGTAFFFVARFLIPGLWGIAALATLTPDLAGGNSLLAMPRLLAQVVPAGLMGLLIAAMLAADMSTDSSYMLTWGGVIYNDILAPFRKKVWSEKRGLYWNRVIIGCVGVFLLIYGLWYKLEGDLWTYLGLTGSIYLSSMSVLLIACVYWKQANSWGAAAAIFFGALLPIVTLVLQKTGPWTEWFRENDTTCGALTYVVVAAAMVVGSLLKIQLRRDRERLA
jgi:SSS family solute:Na+ symporter